MDQDNQEEEDKAVLTGVQKIKKRKLGIERDLKDIEKDRMKLARRSQELKRELHATNHQLQRYASIKAIVVATTRDKEQAIQQAPQEGKKRGGKKTGTNQ